MEAQEKNLKDLQTAAAIIKVWQNSLQKQVPQININGTDDSGYNSIPYETHFQENMDDAVDSDGLNLLGKRLSMPQFSQMDTKDQDSVFMESGISPLLEETKNIRTSMMNHKESSDEEEGPAKNLKKKHKSMNKRKRVVMKDGFTNVTYKNISKKRRRYFSDLYTTLLDSSWTYCVLLFAASFYGSWLIFGILYYVIAYCHGDLDAGNLAGNNSDWKPCIENIYGFTSAFLYSLETQHTIGYGGRQITTKCPDAIILVSLQAVLGCIVQAFMVGLIFSKLSRPRNRSKTVIFSTHAVIMQRDKRLCLVIRIGDLRDDNFILGMNVSVKILRRKITAEGELYHEMKMLKVEPDVSKESCVFFVWPLDIVHVIDVESPLYDMTAADLGKERFEILVVLEGANETSNMNFQARTSYLPTEILWGHRFESMLLYRKDHNKFQVNFSAFHSTYEVDTPACSARSLDTFYTANIKRRKTNVKRRPTSMVNNLSQLTVDSKWKNVRQQMMPEYFSETPQSRSRSNSNTLNRGQSLKKQRSMTAISSKLSRTLDTNQNANEKVKWMLGTSVGSPAPNTQPMYMPNVNNTANQPTGEEDKFVAEDSDSDLDSANAAESKRIQSMKYSKL